MERTNSRAWGWKTCWLWSELVFAMIADGHLPYGWAAIYSIKDIQRDTCIVGTRNGSWPMARRYQTAGKSYTSNLSSATATSNNKGRQDFNHKADRKPCHPGNWCNDCSFSSTQGEEQDKKKAHVCAWGANKYRRTNI